MLSNKCNSFFSLSIYPRLSPPPHPPLHTIDNPNSLAWRMNCLLMKPWKAGKVRKDSKNEGWSAGNLRTSLNQPKPSLGDFISFRILVLFIERKASGKFFHTGDGTSTTAALPPFSEIWAIALHVPSIYIYIYIYKQSIHDNVLLASSNYTHSSG